MHSRSILNCTRVLKELKKHIIIWLLLICRLKNYKAALASLDKIRNKDSRLEEAYQRVAFFRGLELFKNMELEAAIDMFDKSLKYEKYNRQLRARAIYWKGEACYRLGSMKKQKLHIQTSWEFPDQCIKLNIIL